MSQSLPPRPNLDLLRKLAKERLATLRAADPGARLADAQLAVAREHGFPSWRALKARVDEVTDDPDVRIVRAAETGDAPALAALLDRHPRKLALTGGRWGQPLLHLAAARGHLAAVELLLARGSDVNARDKADNAYALHFAAEGGHLPVVARLVEAGGDVHGDGDDHELGVLGWATCFAHTRRDVADHLIARGARPHVFAAIALDLEDLVRRLVAADPTQLARRMSRNEHRRTPLHHAVSKNRPAMVGLLLDLGADPYLRDDAGATPAAYASDPAVDRAIFDRLRIDGAKPDLVTALALGDFAAAADLLAADPAQLAPGGSSDRALHFLAARRNVAAVRWLVDHGADVNAKRVLWNCNQTALHVCAEHGIADVAEVLLDAGADTTIRDDRYNAPPLGWATHCDRPAVAALLRSRGATE